MADRLATPPRPAYVPPVLIPTRIAPRDVGDSEAHPPRRPRWRSPVWIGVAVIGTLTLAVHVAANALSPYGLHRDELLYLAMGTHLHFWQMDFPPGIAVVAEVSRALLGSSLVAIRLASALAAAVLVTLAYGMTQRLGGRGRSCVLAGLAVLASPLFLRSGTLFQPVVFDQLWWTLGLVALVRVCANAPARKHRMSHPAMRPPMTDRGAWLSLGAVCGLGLLTKFSIAFFSAAVLVAILVTPLRRRLATPWPWLALAVALAIGSPSVVGQIRLGWPVVGQLLDLRASQLERIGPVDFVVGQLVLGPSLALAGLGLWHLLRDPDSARWRATTNSSWSPS